MTADSELLRCYAETRSEPAFAELVQRHLNLVYSAALRQVNGDAQLAQDVAQSVFTDLARKAPALSRRNVLTSWLYTSTHFAAAKAVRTERRRQARDQEAHAMQELLQGDAPQPDWEKLRPVLDQVMHELQETDREVILLRYFENRQLADIGEKLGLSDDAARKRVDRAIEKLRGFLSRRGITTTVLLGTVLTANAVQAAPAGLAVALTATSLAGVAAGTGATLAVLKAMTMTKLQVGLIGALAVAAAITPFAIQHEGAARAKMQSLQQQINDVADLRAENERLSNLVAEAKASPSMPPEQLGELLRLRSEVNNLRRQTNELAKLRTENQRLQSAPKPPTQSASIPESVPKESWAFVGYADPESAFQTAVWAISRGNSSVYRASVVPGGREIQELDRQTEAEFAAKAQKEFGPVTAFKIIEKEQVSENEVLLTVYASGIDDTGKFRVERFGNEWRFSGPAKKPRTQAQGAP